MSAPRRPTPPAQIESPPPRRRAAPFQLQSLGAQAGVAAFTDDQLASLAVWCERELEDNDVDQFHAHTAPALPDRALIRDLEERRGCVLALQSSLRGEQEARFAAALRFMAGSGLPSVRAQAEADLNNWDVDFATALARLDAIQAEIRRRQTA